MKPISSFGFYNPYKWLNDPKENSAWNAYVRSTKRRFLAPAAASECFVVSHWGYKGLYNDEFYIDSQYIYASVYDAMRQVNAYKADESEGEIELLIYTDSSGLEVVRTWLFEIEGYQNMDGDYEIENSGWVKA
jgi:hypothetical protein